MAPLSMKTTLNVRRMVQRGDERGARGGGFSRITFFRPFGAAVDVSSNGDSLFTLRAMVQVLSSDNRQERKSAPRLRA